MSSGPTEARRLAFLLTQDRGGPVDVTVELALALSQVPGWTVQVFGPRPARGAERIAALHTEVLVEGKGALDAILRARRQVGAWRPDVVHAQDRRSGLVCAGAAWGPQRAGRPRAVVHSYHGVPDDVTEPWFRGVGGPPPSRYTRTVLAADAVVARTVTRTVVPAASMGRFLQQRLRVPAHRVVHIDNGLPLPPASVPAGPVRRLLFVGLLVRRKGVHLLLEAMARAALPPDVVLQVAGDGPERADLEATASRLGLQGRVTFLGFRTDVPRLLGEADAFVLPSAMEQQPLVLIEALGAGKPVVATDVGGVADMVTGAGTVVPPGDVTALARALEELTTGDRAVDWGRRAAVLARERFSVEVARDAHLALYEDLLANGSGARA
ncbi:Glycosyltransferase involved in cell wall bisynthesis [Geodermatophilus dictyosporus]|uniref:Glycosyltransferase involved in cell wall bisynthesis n=1 Tax=Geodermatophilus dictyosporus TaxID=1523247 RepID=A0A1I5JWD2_9ACTN|nr:glycosyltransferase family 4 protein [Geodermatophilus dictyosporus]SFO77087.1 Glycosyltransferase involved in cell wall bisynthesis [Geodermatophilus dictyosporus]